MKQDATFDTSFWGNAYRVGLLSFVREQFTLYYTSSVAEELPDTNSGGREFRRLVQRGEVVNAEPTTIHLLEFGAGERSAISLALENEGWFLFVDDYRPFLEGLKRGLNVVSTPMFVLTLYRSGIVQAKEALDSLGRLAALQTVSPHLFAMALARLGDQAGTLRES
ncbi:MAG: hypothetical protein ACRDJE_29770 [Dehalococcoidia bacterium]